MNDIDSAPSVIKAEGLQKWFDMGRSLVGSHRGYVKAVDNVSFEVRQGETLGLVGESGSGKTTLGRTLLRLTRPTGGTIRFFDQDITRYSRRRLRSVRRNMQLIFQDPVASLNPRMTVERILATPLMIHERGMSRRERTVKIGEALARVGLTAAQGRRYPHEFSGGQRQRIGIARALMMEPDLLVADEPVSSLDVSIQGQVLNLLMELKEELGLTILFIAHDLAVVAHISNRIAVMYLGKIMEIAETQTLLTHPQHPYTEALLSAAPIPDPTRHQNRIVLSGDIPSPINSPSGCVFRTRCPYALPECASTVPALREVGKQQFKACIRDDLTIKAPALMGNS